jgi:streptogramin lyase
VSGTSPSRGQKRFRFPILQSSHPPPSRLEARQTGFWWLKMLCGSPARNPYAILRIDPSTNKFVPTIRISGESCSGLAFGFGSVWAPVCGRKPALVRTDAAKNTISATLPIAPAGPEGGITASDDSVWLATDKKGPITRIDPSTNNMRQKISIPPGSYNPCSAMALSGSPEWRVTS